MKRLTKLNPDLCPLAIASIIRRSKDDAPFVAFKGMLYEVVGLEVWHVCAHWSDNEPYENAWTDEIFELRR